MVAKQLSIFLENKSGRLTEVTEVLAKEGVNLSALCIAENADFGILRGIVSEPDKAYKALKDNHFAVNVTDVVGINCPNIPGSLSKVLRLFYVRESVWLTPIHKPFVWQDVMADKRKAHLYPSTWVSYLPVYAARHSL